MQQVEGDQHHRHLLDQLGARSYPSEARLQAGEVKHRSGPIRDQLPVDHQPLPQARGRPHDLGEGGGHVVEVAREEARTGLGDQVQLGADAVVLVLDPGLRADPPHHLLRVGDRGGEHAADRAAELQRSLGQPIIARQDGRRTRLAEQHAGAPHRLDRPVKGRGDRLLQQPLAQPDSQLARGDTAHETRLFRSGSVEQAGHLGHPHLGRGGLADGAPPRIQRRQGEALAMRLVSGQQLRGGVAQVGVAQVGGAQCGLVGAAGHRQRLAQLHPTEPQLVARPGERAAREEGGRDRQILPWQRPEVGRQQVALAQF